MAAQPLSPFVLTDWNRAKSYLQRQSGADDDFVKLAVNQATAKLEELAGMRLRSRMFRPGYQVAGCVLVSNNATVTGPGGVLGFTTGTTLPRVGDIVLGTGVQTSPQSLVESITDNTHLVLTGQATQSVTSTLTFGLGNLRASGTGTATIVLPMRPVTQLFSARYKDSNGAYLSIDVTGAELGDDGSIMLRNESWPAGRANIEVECEAGWPMDGGSDLRYQWQWQRLESYCLELARLYFEKYKTGIGQSDYEGGGFRVTAKPIEVPEHIRAGMLEFAEVWP